MKQKICSVTLIELLIGTVLFTVIALILSTMDLFSRHHVLSSERQARLQNDLSYIIGHMSKELARAIGNERVNGGDSSVVNNNPIGVNAAIRVYIDSNATGGPGDGARDTLNDRWIAYRFTGNVGPPANRYQIRYCPRCTNANCVTCAAPNPWGSIGNILSRQISAFAAFRQPASGGGVLTANFVEIQLTACQDPDGVPDACGTAANPNVTIRSRIKLPSVSTN